jgi:cobalt-zinc-cadmium efflux system outer membrane protein
MQRITPVARWRPVQARRKFVHLFWLLFLLGGPALAQVDGAELTLPEAFSRAMADNPGLRVFDLRLRGLEGRRLSAKQSPAYELGLEAENFLGSGELRGTESAEITLTLSSVIELGDKREARRAVVDSQLDLLEVERRAEALDLLGQITSHFVEALAIQEQLKLAAQAIELSQETHAIVSRRAREGAAPEADVLRAQAALSQARLELDRLQAEFDSRKMALAALWGATETDFHSLRGDLFQLPEVDSFESLFQRAKQSPAIGEYASEQRIREAELTLARSESRSNVSWQIGLRRVEETGDSAVVAGVSVPLFTGERNRGVVRAAAAARNETEYQRENALVLLHARLFEAYRKRQMNIETVERMRSEVLPSLSEALELTRAAYESGRYSYLEWLAAQRELLTARQSLVDAASAAHLNQALIEQLTAQPMATAGIDPAHQDEKQD